MYFIEEISAIEIETAYRIWIVANHKMIDIETIHIHMKDRGNRKYSKPYLPHFLMNRSPSADTSCPYPPHFSRQ